MTFESDSLIIKPSADSGLKARLSRSRQGLDQAWAYDLCLREGPKVGQILISPCGDQWEFSCRIKRGHRHQAYVSQAIKDFLPTFMQEKAISRLLSQASCKNQGAQAILAKAGFVRIHQDMGPCHKRGKEARLCQYLMTHYREDQIARRLAIDKGWSNDRKYKVTMEDGRAYLLRLSPGGKRAQKALEFEAMRQLSHLQLVTVRPLQLDSYGEEVAFLQEWIEGEDVQDRISGLTDSQAYLYGREAGQLLKLIHSLPAPGQLPPWDQRFNDKIDRKIKDYLACSLRYENDQAFFDFIQANRHRLEGRPQTLQHGDFHMGNMMIDKEDRLRIIDFDRMDYGDPWEEFNRMVFTAQLSPAMASGIVDAYFDDQIPPDFWPLLALYMAVNSLSSLPWALAFGQDDVNRMRQLADQVLAWHQGMTQPLPSWYLKDVFPQGGKSS